VNFKGSDTVPGIQFANEFYGERMAGFSIPAAEHSTITSWGGPDKEIHAFRNMVNQFGGPGKIYACVSDSYDILAACEWKWPSLESLIISKGGTLVVRPDSGNPITMPADVIDTLMGRFGNKVNSKGYLVLPDHIRVIQGDGIGRASLPKILHELDLNKFSIDNIAFGMGGGLLQQCDRDTCSFAMKVNAIKRHVVGQWEPVSKQPKGIRSKVSKGGRLAFVKNDYGQLMTVNEDQLKNCPNQLQPVWDDTLGLGNEQSFTEIRERAKDALING
jgi:nicotinamide phosphoribosyltransferase